MSCVLAVLAALVPGGCEKSESRSPGDLASTSSDVSSGVITVEEIYSRPVNKLADAVTASLNSDDLGLQSDTFDALTGQVVALALDGHRVIARITPVGEAWSRVSIRVVPGNKNLAGLILERIAETLGSFPAK
jgi:hypothetical protein